MITSNPTLTSINMKLKDYFDPMNNISHWLLYWVVLMIVFVVAINIIT